MDGRSGDVGDDASKFSEIRIINRINTTRLAMMSARMTTYSIAMTMTLRNKSISQIKDLINYDGLLCLLPTLCFKCGRRELVLLQLRV